MCWKIIKKNFDKNPEKYHRIADKDITVYKFGERTDDKFYPIFQYKYGYSLNALNKEIRLVLEETDEFFGGTRKIINSGYHSYSEEYFICINWVSHTCLSEVASITSSNIIDKFLIPKGTEYYENEVGEIVSSQIMWTGERYHINEQNKIICVGQ